MSLIYPAPTQYWHNLNTHASIPTGLPTSLPHISFATSSSYPKNGGVPAQASLTLHPSRLIVTNPLVAAVTVTESNALIRRFKHKEVEIRRRKKISDLFNELSNELECGPTDKASILTYALATIRQAKGDGCHCHRALVTKRLSAILSDDSDNEKREIKKIKITDEIFSSEPASPQLNPITSAANVAHSSDADSINTFNATTVTFSNETIDCPTAFTLIKLSTN